MDYTALADMTALITERYGSLPSDSTALLEALAGTRPPTAAEVADEPELTEVTVFRPYAVLAELISTRWQQYTSARSASGAAVEWGSPEEARHSLERLQAKLDKRFGLTVPDVAGNTFESVF
jgi:hypothetical protein